MPAQEEDPGKRALLVLKWFLTTIRPRLYGAAEKPVGKKPLNPFLGELLMGCWDDEECGQTRVWVEQVGHHPPCTAVCVRNEKFGVKVCDVFPLDLVGVIAHVVVVGGLCWPAVAVRWFVHYDRESWTHVPSIWKA